MTPRATGIAMGPRQGVANISTMAQNDQSSAGGGFEQAGSVEVKREGANAQIRQANKAGNAALGSTIGGIVGTIVPGIGTMIGAAAGGLIGGAIG